MDVGNGDLAGGAASFLREMVEGALRNSSAIARQTEGSYACNSSARSKTRLHHHPCEIFWLLNSASDFIIRRAVL